MVTFLQYAAMLALQALYYAIAIPSVCLSHAGIVKSTAHSTVQFALSDSKNASSFVETKNHFPGTTPSR